MLVGQTVRVNPPFSVGAPGGKTFRWRIVKAPRGSHASLISPHSATPRFRADRNGTYVLTETVTRAGKASIARVTVDVRPDDAPIGVPLETNDSFKSDGAIRIDGQGVKDTVSRHDGIFYAVLERGTRAVVESATVQRNGTGVQRLVAIAKQWSGTDGYLMIVGGPAGVPQEAFLELDRLTNLLGAGTLTADDHARLKAEARFSIIGIPGGAPDAAWVNIGGRAGKDNPPGDIIGFLAFNPATEFYDYVNPERPTFDTQASGPLTGRNIITVDHRPYQTSLPAGFTDGFQVLVLDSVTLEELANVALPTNGPGDVAAQQRDLPARIGALAGAKGDLGRPPLVIIQSIGRPKGQSVGWAYTGDWIQRLGGTRLVFDALDGTRDYTLVGSLDAGRAAVEAGTTTGDARLVGVLARTHDMGFKPTLAGPPGEVNTDMIDMAYQAPKPFPAFDTPQKRAAETYIGKQIHLSGCSEDVQTCPIRKHYYQDTKDALFQAEIELTSRRLDCPGEGQSSYCRDAYDPVRVQLEAEFSAVIRVRNYFAALRTPFDMAAEKGRVDLEKVSTPIYNAVNPPLYDNVTANNLDFASKVASIGGAAPPPAGNIAKAISVSLGFAASATRKNGSPVLANKVKVRAGELAKQFQQQMFDAEQSTKPLELLFVSDYGKLMGIADKILTKDWTLNGDEASLNRIDLAARRWYAEQLTPVAYPWLLAAYPPPPAGPGSANGLSCPGGLTSGLHPWSSEPAKAQFRTIEGWNPDGSPFRLIFFFSTSIFATSSPSPAQAVADLLFDPVNARTGALGLDRLQFLSPRVFGKLRYAIDTHYWCNLLPVDPPAARAQLQLLQVRAHLERLHLRPAALFPTRLPARLTAAAVFLTGSDHYTITWQRGKDAHRGLLGHVTLSRSVDTRLNSYLRAARRSGFRPRTVRVGSRHVWFLCTPACGYAWIDNRRTYGVFGTYPTAKSDAALEHDERELITHLAPIVP